jgi:hypothetical protein
VPVRAANLAAQLDTPPAWLADFAGYLVGRHHPSRACAMLSRLGRLLTDGGPTYPQALLSRAGPDDPLIIALEDFFTRRQLALPIDREEQHAAARRQRRIDAVPEPLRPAVSGFADQLIAQRERARRAGTKPRGHRTIDIRLDAVRDLALFVVSQQNKTDWATIDVADVESFLSSQPSRRASRLAGLRQFFAFAAHRRIILIDPTRKLIAPQPWGFRGPSLTVDRQRDLFHRWTTKPAVHPHEAFVGLMALLHGATTTEIRHLDDGAINHVDHSLVLGRRPQPTPLDPWTWAALQGCLNHRESLHSTNPHLLITRRTKATRAAASEGYIKHTLDPVSLQPRILRSTRLLQLTTTLDPKLVAVVFGMNAGGVLCYLADSVDSGRLSETTT